MKQTAVEWLVEQMKDGSAITVVTIDYAKQMEKQQMFDYVKANFVIGEISLKFHQEQFEQYYNETFKSE